MKSSSLKNENQLLLQATIDPEAFAKIYDYYFTRVYNYVRSRVNRSSMADDLTSQIFERVLFKLDKFHPERGSFRTWLFTIAHNIITDYLRNQEKQRYRLSRFTYSRRDGQEIILESPLANGRVVLTHWLAAAVLHLLAEACTAGEIRTQFPTLPKKSLQLFLELLLSAGILEEVDDAGISAGEGDEVLQQWEFHDLLFHARSRLGPHEQPVGGTYRFWGRIAPLPAVKNPMSGERIKLYRPDMEKLREDDYPFSLVLEERKSIRDYADEPISVQQLGEFLYRSARIKELIKANPPAGLLYEASYRPYLGGGAAYELEIYLAVNKCEGLPGGLYHYDPWQHELEKLTTRTNEVEGLLKYCSNAAGLKELPPVSLHITARFQRVAWKYQSIAYSVILKDVGALYQTLYLVATAMDLAPTAIGSGPAKLLSRMAGLNYLEESAVGEFILGNKRI